MTPRTAVVAAFRREIEVFARAAGLTLQPAAGTFSRAFRGLWLGRDLAAAAVGMGRSRTAQGCDGLVALFRPERIILCGAAGGLSRAVQPLDLIVPRAVAHCSGDRSGVLHLCRLHSSLWASLTAAAAAVLPAGATVHSGMLLAVDRPLLSARERDRLRKCTGAVSVDMESRAVAERAAVHNLPAGVIKVVTDEADAAAAASFQTHLGAAAERIALVLTRFFAQEAQA